MSDAISTVAAWVIAVILSPLIVVGFLTRIVAVGLILGWQAGGNFLRSL